MVTLGGMVELVTLLTTHSPPAYPQETPVIQAMSALHDVFASLHVSILYPYYILMGFRMVLMVVSCFGKEYNGNPASCCYAMRG